MHQRQSAGSSTSFVHSAHVHKSQGQSPLPQAYLGAKGQATVGKRLLHITDACLQVVPSLAPALDQQASGHGVRAWIEGNGKGPQ